MILKSFLNFEHVIMSNMRLCTTYFKLFAKKIKPLKQKIFFLQKKITNFQINWLIFGNPRKIYKKTKLTDGTADIHNGERLIRSEDGILDPISEWGHPAEV